MWLIIVLLTSLAAASVAFRHLDAIILLIAGGALSLGMPQITLRDRLRWWHPWLNDGILPLAIGLVLGPALEGWLSYESARSLRPLLALLLTAAGFLVGTQLRVAFLMNAGIDFLFRHTRIALLMTVCACVPAMAVAWSTQLADWFAIPLAAACLSIVSSQRAPSVAEGMPRRNLIRGHVAPSGWWNLVALVILGGSLSFGLHEPHLRWSFVTTQVMVVAAPTLLGLVLGWLASKSRERAETHLFLLAILMIGGGAAVAAHAVPIFFGMIAGAVFINVAPTRAGDIERLLLDAEQPIVIGCGLFSGLCAAAHAQQLWAWGITLTVMGVRYFTRDRWSPTEAFVPGGSAIRFSAPGAAGVLMIGTLVLAPEPSPVLVLPVTALVIIATIAWQLVDLRQPKQTPA